MERINILSGQVKDEILIIVMNIWGQIKLLFGENKYQRGHKEHEDALFQFFKNCYESIDGDNTINSAACIESR